MGKRIEVAKRLEHLPKPYFTAAYAEMNAQTDRGAAIAGSALLDLTLRSTIEARFCDDDDIKRILFEERGAALCGFSARIHLGYALSLYSYQAWRDMCALRDIRNAFAHNAEAFGFDRQDVATLCSSLWFQKTIHYGKRPMPKTPREMFIREIELLTDGLAESKRRAMGGPASTFLEMGPAKGYTGRGASLPTRAEPSTPGSLGRH